jgi:hypothetical protein
MILSRLLFVCLITVAFSAQVFAEYPQGFSQRSIRKIERKAKGNPSASALSDVCKSVTPIHALFKSTGGGHIRGDARESGFSIICSRSECFSFPASAYYSDGTYAFKIGYYGRWVGNGQPRAYCAAGGAPACNAKSITANARAQKRDGKVYIQKSAKTKTCVSADPTRRNGSPF